MKQITTIILLFFSIVSFGQKNYRIIRLPFNNNEEQEMAPVIFENGIVFSSNKKNSVLMVTKDTANNLPYNLYFVEKKGKKWGSPSLFSSEISSKLSESSVSFSSDYKSMYLTRSQLADKKMSVIKGIEKIPNGIFECVWDGKDWKVVNEFSYNDPSFDVAFPSLSPDGTTLYFSSRQGGGYGGYDIYYTENKSGNWSEPKNLGPTINTSENEVFPFYHQNKRLYFSSRGHGARGNLDIFYTEKRKGEWSKPVNMPKPFNSRKDDFAYTLSAEMDTGYFTSNRRGSDDIYVFISPFPAFDKCPEQKLEKFCYTFSEMGSMDLDTTSLKYEWDFGDGNKKRALEARHCYEEVGFYLVSLNVIDTLTGEVYFSEATYDLMIEKLEQPFITSADTVRIDEECIMDGKESAIHSFKPDEYYWDFGDGNVEMGIDVKHTYTVPGEYYIRLGVLAEEDDEKRKKKEEAIDRVCSQKKIVVLE